MLISWTLKVTELEDALEQRRGSRDLVVSSNELYLRPDCYSLSLKGNTSITFPVNPSNAR